MQGLAGDGSVYPFEATGGTRFTHPGDPTKDTGPNDSEYVDSDFSSCGDRYFLMSVGALEMAPGDSQEVIYGIINVAKGDPLDSYLALKDVDKKVQNFVDNQFRFTDPPEPPHTSVTTLDDQIIITWDYIAESYVKEDKITASDSSGQYVYEGYNVYQLNSPYGDGKTIRIATFDKINGVKNIFDEVFDSNYGLYVNVITQHGSDSGIKHDIQITKDALSGNKPLLINREYYFAVTAYAYNPIGIPKTLESEKEIIAMRPANSNTWQAKNDTIGFNYQFSAEHVKGNGHGTVAINVIDPTQITGDDYKITFNDNFVNGNDTLEITNWNLINISTGETLLTDQLIESGINKLTGDTLGVYSSPVIEGLQVLVYGVEPDIDYMEQVVSYGILDGVPYWRYPDWTTPNYNTPPMWLLNTFPAYGPSSPETFYNSVTVYSGGDGTSNQGISSLVPDDFECRFTGEGQAFDYFGGTGLIDVPFEWWNIGSNTLDDVSDDYKLISYINDDDGDGKWGLVPFDHESSGGDNDPYTDRIYVMAPTNDTPGTKGHDDFFENVLVDASNVASWTSGPGENDPGGPMDTWNVFSRLVFMNWNGGDVDDPTFPANVDALEPETGSIFRIVTTKPNTSGDEYEFSTATLVGTTIKYRPKNVNVWPNPYFGYNPEETCADDRQIHFTNLPGEGKCFIQIFDLAGHLVRKLNHNNGTQFEIWDVRDHYSNPVASGMYIVHIDTEQGQKLLKIAIIQPQS